MVQKSAWNTYGETDWKTMDTVVSAYKNFLDRGKTERECAAFVEEEAKALGFLNLRKAVEEGTSLKAGDKVYYSQMGKSLFLAVVGREPLEKGLKIIGGHIDSPRLDIKQNPLFEDGELAYLDTHYYGGIKKYQWVAMPLALHGVVVKKDGTKIEVCVGEDENDPVVGITDLLPHMAQKQMEKKASEFIEGEDLNILIASRPGEGEKDPVKEAALKLLEDKYSIAEEDFLSAELEVVPAGRARDYGLDSSMVMAYGQDDRVCSYQAWQAMKNMEAPDRTCVCLLVDKEEIGSAGATGMQSMFFENSVAELMDRCGQYSELALRRCLSHSRLISADVTAAFDPTYADEYEKNNASWLGKGIAFNKFTGSRGKSNANDANAEYLASLLGVMDSENVHYQVAEMGKVDHGGGGTICFILARYGMEAVDCGVPVLSMHAPWEITSKADIYEAYKGYKAFFEKA